MRRDNMRTADLKCENRVVNISSSNLGRWLVDLFKNLCKNIRDNPLVAGGLDLALCVGQVTKDTPAIVEGGGCQNVFQTTFGHIDKDVNCRDGFFVLKGWLFSSVLLKGVFYFKDFPTPNSTVCAFLVVTCSTNWVSRESTQEAGCLFLRSKSSCFLYKSHM